MSKWLGAIAGNVESLLDKVDQVAGHALQKDSPSDQNDGDANQSQFSQWQPPATIISSTSTYTPFLSSSTRKVSPAKTNSRSDESRSSPSSVMRSGDKLPKTGVSHESKDGTSDRAGNGKDPADEELFMFLNKSTPPGETVSTTRPSSTGSLHIRRTPESQSTDVAQGDDITGFTDSINNGNSSGYHSSAEEMHSNAELAQQNLSSLDQENQLLKSEITSLNREMQSVIHRVQTMQEELNRANHKMDVQGRQLSAAEQISRELRSRESDLQELLSTKETQLSVLRMRLEEADRLLVLEKQRTTDVQADRDRILKDHSSSTGYQSQALDTLQEKLNEAESALRRETETSRKSLNETTERLNKLEAERQSLASQLGTLHRTLDKEKVHSNELSSHLKTSRLQGEAAKQELIDYKEKAARILQSKDKLIASLKEGSVSGSTPRGNIDVNVLLSEVESIRQERDVLHDELRSSQHVVENLRTELADVENQMQQESETATEQISSLEDQLQVERRRRDDLEMEITKQKQELRYVHEELLKQKTAFQSRLQDRDSEITRLRNQLTMRSVNASSQEELENRLHSLTESLIQKQTMLEALSTEKSSLVLQLERMEKQCREAEASALRASTTVLNMADNDEVRQRLPNFMHESPFDGKVTRRVKMAANVIDKFSVRLGVFLRRYPIARVFVILYMGLLHLWVMIVLLTYQPEIHSDVDALVPHAIH